MKGNILQLKLLYLMKQNPNIVQQKLVYDMNCSALQFKRLEL